MADALIAVQQYIDAFNRGDNEAMAAIFGQHVKQTGAYFTVALRKVGDDWRIAAWAWAKGTRA